MKGLALPDRTAAERFLVATTLNPFLAEVAAQREKETATIEKHLKISLNELIHRQNLRMAEIHEQGQFGDETLMAANMKKVEDKLDELNGRLEQRTAELRREAECMIGDIQHIGRAWVLPHPERNSPQSTPSEADIKVTRDLIRAGQLLKMEVLDHVIILSKCLDKITYAECRIMPSWW